jgi:hypothetical protein
MVDEFLTVSKDFLPEVSSPRVGICEAVSMSGIAISGNQPVKVANIVIKLETAD